MFYSSSKLLKSYRNDFLGYYCWCYSCSVDFCCRLTSHRNFAAFLAESPLLFGNIVKSPVNSSMTSQMMSQLWFRGLIYDLRQFHLFSLLSDEVRCTTTKSIIQQKLNTVNVVAAPIENDG